MSAACYDTKAVLEKANNISLDSTNILPSSGQPSPATPMKANTSAMSSVPQKI